MLDFQAFRGFRILSQRDVKMVSLVHDTKQKPVVSHISNQSGELRWTTCPKPLPLLLAVLLFSSIGSDAWKLPGFTGRSKAVAKTENELLEYSSASLPERSLSGQFDENSYCFRAYSEIPRLCETRLREDRGLLATLLANCHLEEVNRNTIWWDPVHRLKHTTKEEFSLVELFIPLVRDICGRSGDGNHVAHLRMHFRSGMKLWASLENLNNTVNRAAELNLESRESRDFYEQQTAEAIKGSEEIQIIVEKLKFMSSHLDSQQKQLEEFYDKIGSRIAYDAAEKVDTQRMLNDHADHAKLLFDGILGKLHTERDYDELQTKFTDLQSEIEEAEGETVRCRKKVYDVGTSGIHSGHFQNVRFFSVLWNRVRTSAFGELLWSALSAPFRVSRLLNFLGVSEMFAPGAQTIVFTTQAGVSIVSVWTTFKILLLLRALIDNGNEIRGTISTAMSMFLLPQLPRSSEERSETGGQGNSGGDMPRDGEKLNKRAMRKLVSRLERRFESSLRRTLEEMNFEKRFSAKVEEVGYMHERNLLARIDQVEDRQVRFLHALQAAKEVPRLEHTHAKSEAELVEETGETATGMQLRSSQRRQQDHW